MFDVIIKGGQVVDGRGGPPIDADVAITGDRIAAVGRWPSTVSAPRVIDATDRVVAPGFIDLHSHSDFVVFDENHGEILAPFAAQGITTLITGNCGYSPAPVVDHTAEFADYTAFLRASDARTSWPTFAGFLADLDDRGVMFNVAPLVAHGALRVSRVGFAPRALTPDELRSVRQDLREALREGAWGLSSGLLYAPGIYTPPDEIDALAAELRPFDALYASHIRGSSETLLEATGEVIAIGERQGIRVQHSHLEAFGRPHWPKLDGAISLHEAARDRGIDVGFDIFPYVAGNSTLLAIFPPWALSGGVDRLLERLRDPMTRARIARSVERDIPGWPSWEPGGWPHNLSEATGWDNIMVLWVESSRNKELEGRMLREIAGERRRHPFDVAADLAIEEGGHVMALYFGVNGDLEEEPGLERLIAHPWTSIETDAILIGRGKPHPAGHGTFARLLGHFVRDRGLLSLPDAVRRATSLPAQRVGLQGRGTLGEGNFADVVVFDPNAIADTTTYTSPDSPPRGIEHVLVNGRVLVEAGAVRTASRAGRVLRRGDPG